MQTTSEAFDTAIGSSSRELHCKLTIQTADLETYNLTSDDIIAGSLKVNWSCFLDGFELGTCFASDMSVSLKNLNGEWDGIDLEGATVWPYSGIRLPDATIEYILLGTFIIDEPGRPDAELSIKAVDRLVLLDKPFSGVSVIWPATNYEILQAISTHCSVPLATSVSSALHMSYSVTEAPEGDYSCRDIVEQICIMAAGFGRMSRIGEFEIGTLPDLTGETFDVNLTTANRFAFRQTSEPVTITGMTYKDIQETVQLGTEEYSLKIETLGILQANRDTVLAAIWSEISGYTYVGFESEYPGNPAIDVGDSIYQLTKDEREIVSLISGHNFVHGGSCKLTAVMRPKLAADWAAKNTKRLTAIAQKLDTTENTLTSFQQASAQMSDLLTIGLGLYRTEEVLEDGSAIQYMHNLPLLSESDVIWKQTALAWAYSTDGGTTWLGYDVSGNMVAKILSIVGINAEWIRSGLVAANRVEISADSSFAAGYDPSTKRRVFTSTPTTPYEVGDLWSGGSAGDLKRCKTARASGAYVAADWELATKYTDDTATVTAKDNIAQGLGYANYAEMIAKAALGKTIIDGGYFNTTLVDVHSILAHQIVVGSETEFGSGYDPTLIAVGGRNLALGTEIDPWGVYSADTSLYRSNVDVTNLVTNGNFVNATGWTANEGSLSVANNTATHTSNGSQTYARITRTDSASTVGHTYALTLRVRVTNASCTSLSARIYDGTTVTIQANPVENQWYQITVLRTIVSPQAYIWILHNYSTAAIASGKKMEVQYVSCVDLSAYFVPVPTQSVFARWIATQPNSWINGTANTKGMYRTNSITAVAAVTGSSKSLGMQQTSTYRKMKLTAGTQYTLSVLARGNANVNLNACVILNEGAANQALTTSWQMTSAWQKFYVTFTADANTGASTGSHLLFRYVGGVVSGSTWFEIQEVKLEAGNKATDWCPDTMDMAFPDTTTIDGGNVKTGKIESHDGKTYFDLDNDEIQIEGLVNGKKVNVEMSAAHPFLLSQEDAQGTMQPLIYITDDSGYSGPNILVTSRYDINEDGKVDSEDVLLIVNYVLGIPGTYPPESRMDLNGDGMVSSSDATYWYVYSPFQSSVANASRAAGVDYTGFWVSPDYGVTKTYLHTF